MPIPGGAGAYVANGSEHDGIGDTTHLPERHIQMTTRRFNKLKLLENEKFESINPDASVVIMPWGGSKGPAYEAFQEIVDTVEGVGWLYTMYVNPLNPELIDQLKKADLILVPELNYQGQFSMILRTHGINAKAITQFTGLPFKVRDLVESVKNEIATYRNETINA